jgi:RNase P subunit RPR2
VSLQPEDEEHHWCKYCRRPTVFKYYTSHKRLGTVDPWVRRCCICGASERIAIHTRSDRTFRVH